MNAITRSGTSPSTAPYDPQSPESPFPLPAMDPPPHSHYSEPTTNYWQEILPRPSTPPLSAPHQYSVPVALPDSSILRLPIRPLASNPSHAVASLLVNQASFAVVRSLAHFLSDRLAAAQLEADIVIGLPSLGNTLAPLVAERLGFDRYVPLGYSVKFWYRDALSTAVSSITSPGLGQKRVYLDPYLLPLVKGKRVIIVDDAVSSGSTVEAVWDLLETEAVGCQVVACGVVMKQGERWKEVLGKERSGKVVWVFESPLLEMVDGGWGPRA